MLNAHAVDLGKVLFVMGGAHLHRAPAIENGDIIGAQALCLHGNINRCVAAADHHHPAANWQLGKIISLPQRGNVVYGVVHSGQIRAWRIKGPDPILAQTKEDRVKIQAQLGQGKVPAQGPVRMYFNTADGGDE